jgi:hypothetical protein
MTFMTLSFFSVPSSWPSSLSPSSFSDMTSQSPGISSSSSGTFNPNMGDTAATQQQQVSPWPQSSTAAAGGGGGGGGAAGDFASFVPGGQQAAQLQGRKTERKKIQF